MQNTRSTGRRPLSRKGLAVTSAVILVLGLGACGSDDDGGDSEADSNPDVNAKVKITLATPIGEGNAAGVNLWLGEETGCFEKEGLDVEIVSLPGRAAEAVGLVVAGKADLVTSAPDTLLVPAASGDDQGLKWIFTPYQAPVFALAVPKDSDVESAADLESGTVGMSALGPPFETFTRANITADGADGTKMTPVAVSGPAAFQSLDSGDLDAVVNTYSELDLGSLTTGVGVRILPVPESVSQLFAAGFLVRKDSTDEQLDAYAGYIRCYLEGAIFARENPEAAVHLNWDRYPASKTAGQSDEENMEQASTVMLSTFNRFEPADTGQWGYIAPERWDAYVDYLGLTGKIDPSALHDDSRLDQISDFDEEAVKQQADNWDK